VGPRFETFFDRPWRPEEARSTRLVIIGRELDRASIAAALQ
jgi:cobalamin biosynthesis protein CobW